MIKKFVLIFATICFLAALSNSVIFAEAQQSQDLVRCINKEKASPDTAIKACTAVIQLGQGTKGNLAVALFARGEAYRAMGDNDRAIADYTEAVKLDPKNKEAFKSRGNAYLNKQDYDRAMADYNEAIKLDPNYKEAYNNRGVVYNAKGEFDRAIAEYNKALQIDEKFLLARLGRADTYLNQDAYDKAIGDYTEAIRLDPTNAVGYYNSRASVYFRLGEYDRGNADHERAKHLNEPACQSAVDIAQRVKPFAEIANVMQMATERLHIPDLTFNDPQGRQHRLSEWRGRIVLFNLWLLGDSMTTPNLRALDAVKEKVGDRAFDIVAIDLSGRDMEYRKSVLKRFGIKNLVDYSSPNGIIFDPKKWGEHSKLWQQFNEVMPIKGVPLTLLIDPHGCELGYALGSVNWANSDSLTLLRVIKAALTQ